MSRKIAFGVSYLAIFTAGLAGFAGHGHGAEAWPPAVKPPPATTAALSPADELKTITMAPGFHASIAAADPKLDNPVFITWDFDGRMWVIEYPPYMANGKFDGPEMFQPESRVSVFESTKNDGVYDKKTVFADHLVLPRSILVLGPGDALVHEPDGVFRMRDTNGDGVADTKDRVLDSFGAVNGDVEHTGNGLFWGIDNTIYNSEIGLAMKWKGGKLIPILAASSGQFGVTQDDVGHIYRETNSSAPTVSYVSDTYLARNPQFTRKRGAGEWIGGPSRDANVVWPIRPTLGQNRAYSPSTLRADGTARELTSAGGLTLYRGVAMPDMKGDIITTEPAANLVVRFRVQDSGDGLYVRRAYDKGEFMASTDERFRPVYATSGPDGAIYIADMYSGVIQSSGFITRYLADYIVKNKLDDQHGANGRIFRVVEDGAKLSTVRPNLSKATPQQLVNDLANPDGWYRDMAQRWIVVHDLKPAIPLLGALLKTSQNPLARLHALWTLDGLDAVTPAQAQAALRDPSRDVRAAAIRISERWLGDQASPVTKAVVAMVGDTGNDWAVQYQLAASAGSLGDAQRVKTILAICDLYGGDYIALDAAVNGLKPTDLVPALKQYLAQTARLESEAPREQTINTLAVAVIRNGGAADVGDLLAAMTSTDTPAWQRAAILQAGEIVLLGNRDPGLAPPLPPSAGMGAIRDPAGGLGNSAFPQFVASKNAASAKGNADFQKAYPRIALPPSALKSVAGAPTLVLTSEPTGLTALANGTGGDAKTRTRAKALLDLIVWPGKPGYTPA
jgi:hypothetical protein